MNNKVKYSLIAVLLVLGLVGVQQALANPSQFPNHSNCKTSSATTSVTYIGNGTATSTLACDAYNLDAYNTDGTPMDSAALVVQFAGSSTASVLAINMEYSLNGVDYYRDALSDLSTTTNVVDISGVQSYKWTAASSTINGMGLVTTTNGATSTRIIMVKTPTRYVRASFSLSGNAGAVWAEFVPKKEVR